MGKIKYELLKKDEETKARYGLLHTNYGTFETPIFMPVGTLATVKTLSPEELKDINFINPVAPACCQILIGMFEYFEIDITKEIGECIMTGIVTDTGGFSHNTTYETFEFAAEIMRLGVNISEIFRKGLHVKNKASFELQKRAMNRIEFLENGKIAFTYITEDDLEEAHAMQGDHEGIVEIGRNVENVEVSIFIHATKNNCYKVSLRSQDYVDVASIAIMLGGGGHQKAAAATVKGTIEQIKEKVITEVKKQL